MQFHMQLIVLAAVFVVCTLFATTASALVRT
jgi:hypothetical protein